MACHQALLLAYGLWAEMTTGRLRLRICHLLKSAYQRFWKSMKPFAAAVTLPGKAGVTWLGNGGGGGLQSGVAAGPLPASQVIS